MLIEQVSLNENHLVLRDMNGSEVNLTLEDALDLYKWIEQHKAEITAGLKELGIYRTTEIEQEYEETRKFMEHYDEGGD